LSFWAAPLPHLILCRAAQGELRAQYGLQGGLLHKGMAKQTTGGEVQGQAPPHQKYKKSLPAVAKKHQQKQWHKICFLRGGLLKKGMGSAA
jgi:hypothetical protein